MKTTALTVLLTCLATPAFAGNALDYRLPETGVFAHVGTRQAAEPEPTFVPFFGYSLSLSKEQYIESRASLEYLRPNLSLDAVMAIRVRDNAPSPGLGLGWELVRDKWMAKVGVALLFPQQDKPDVTLGASVGVRF